MTVLGEARRFTMADQQAFAAWSGDHNPIHLDPVQARRTLAGQPVVHGIHLLLHALEAAAAGDPATAAPPVWLEANFGRFVLPGEAVTVQVRSRDAQRLRLELRVEGAVRTEVTLGFDAPAVPPAPLDVPPGGAIDSGAEPWSLAPEAMDGLAGRVGAAVPADEWARRFPQAARWLGALRLAALGASTRLVGMVCPGRQSVYTAVKVSLVAPATVGGDGPLAFRVGTPRHGLIHTEIAGGGIAGRITALIRAAPHRQPAMADLAGQVPAGAFASTHALVVGGSRGLGEVAAKLLATGGATITLSYAHGADEARAVAAEIGGTATAIRYDVAGDAAVQLAALAGPPTHVYYFATPQIARATSRFLDAARLDEMTEFFVHGFWRLATAVRALRADARLFYPSTTYVTKRPKGMAEYAMAKAAGELLCAEIDRVLAPLRVMTARLPQLATDQTLTNHGASGGDPVAALLPILDAMQGQGDRDA